MFKTYKIVDIYSERYPTEEELIEYVTFFNPEYIDYFNPPSFWAKIKRWFKKLLKQ